MPLDNLAPVLWPFPIERRRIHERARLKRSRVGYLSSFCGVHAPIAAPLIIIPRWSQCSRKSHARLPGQSATTPLRHYTKRGWINCVSCRYADSNIAILPSSDWKRERIVPPRFNCKLKRALPLQGLLISVRTSGWYARYAWGSNECTLSGSSEIFDRAILGRIFYGFLGIFSCSLKMNSLILRII